MPKAKKEAPKKEAKKKVKEPELAVINDPEEKEFRDAGQK